MSGPRWYVVQCKPGQTKSAERHLKRQGLETFEPRYVVKNRDGDVIGPLFPGYLFVSFDLVRDDWTWRKIHSTVGVLRLLGTSGERPSPVPESLMQGLLAHGGLVEDLRLAELFAIGEQVTFIDGPFEGKEATVLRSGKNRVQLLFYLLGRQSVVYSVPGSLRSVAQRSRPTTVR